MTRRTWQEPVIELPHCDLPEDPAPVGGCDVCAALADQRATARQIDDSSRATDCNIEMRQHPHRRGKR
ncbi:hypothetical protein [Streptomyces sp. NPDC052042]|uniref:hypothetical protein n=1 Tax=Streptomyces sp. NPDC052042 TaxID=3365683 RepID=UPI0037D4673D